VFDVMFFVLCVVVFYWQISSSHVMLVMHFYSQAWRRCKVSRTITLCYIWCGL